MWLRRVKPVNVTSSPKFLFPSFKDIQTICQDDYKSPNPNKPSVFHRVFCPPSADSPRLNRASSSPVENTNATSGETRIESGTDATSVGTRIGAGADATSGGTRIESVVDATIGGTRIESGADATSGGSRIESGADATSGGTRIESGADATSVGTRIGSGEGPKFICFPGSENRIVVYLTGLRIVRPTFEECRAVCSILRGFRVMTDERDVSMDSKFIEELKEIMGVNEGEILKLPRVFIGGRYIGGAEEVKRLHEIGELKKFVEGLPMIESGVCETCGGYRFILCGECSGSRKCYTTKGRFRTCSVCNENGLIRCPSCL